MGTPRSDEPSLEGGTRLGPLRGKGMQLIGNLRTITSMVGGGSITARASPRPRVGVRLTSARSVKADDRVSPAAASYLLVGQSHAATERGGYHSQSTGKLPSRLAAASVSVASPMHRTAGIASSAALLSGQGERGGASAGAGTDRGYDRSTASDSESDGGGVGGGDRDGTRPRPGIFSPSSMAPQVVLGGLGARDGAGTGVAPSIPSRQRI